jgi:hypothetical protein
LKMTFDMEKSQTTAVADELGEMLKKKTSV